MESKTVMKKERKLVFDKYGGKCAYCGCELVKGWHIDHIEPIGRREKWVLGGFVPDDTLESGRRWVDPKRVPDGCDYPERDCIENKTPACASCNINKHEMGIEEFRKQIKGFMKHLNDLNTQFKIAKRYGLVTENDIEVKFYFETYGQTNT